MLQNISEFETYGPQCRSRVTFETLHQLECHIIDTLKRYKTLRICKSLGKIDKLSTWWDNKTGGKDTWDGGTRSHLKSFCQNKQTWQEGDFWWGESFDIFPTPGQQGPQKAFGRLTKSGTTQRVPTDWFTVLCISVFWRKVKSITKNEQTMKRVLGKSNWAQRLYLYRLCHKTPCFVHVSHIFIYPSAHPCIPTAIIIASGARNNYVIIKNYQKFKWKIIKKNYKQFVKCYVRKSGWCWADNSSKICFIQCNADPCLSYNVNLSMPHSSKLMGRSNWAEGKDIKLYSKWSSHYIPTPAHRGQYNVISFCPACSP